MRVIVIGGGAAGFFGAITCAEQAPGADVLLLEKGREVLGKVRISGGGRCNVTHSCFEPNALVQNYPRGTDALRGPFSRFQPSDTIEWFEKRGVALKTEPDGRIFPVTDQSATIIDSLRQAAEKAGVRIRTQVVIRAFNHDGTRFSLTLADGEEVLAERALLATGSDRSGYRWAEAMGHTLRPPVPSLFTFNIGDPRLEGLAGLSVATARVELMGLGLKQEGPVLITHWGLSGPAILKLSAWGARALHDRDYNADLRVNWLPELSSEDLKAELVRAQKTLALKAIRAQNPFRERLANRLWQRFTDTAGISPAEHWADFSREARVRLCAALQESTYHVSGRGLFKEEFVTCGGVNLDEVNFKTLESRRRSGLYFAGEILDIDGLTGGFNFQNAWTTGYLAGCAMATLNVSGSRAAC